jgi:hypothetical protein
MDVRKTLSEKRGSGLALGVSGSIRNITFGLRRIGRLCCLARLTANPFERAGGDETENQEVLLTETVRVLPIVAVFVCALERDVEHWTFSGVLSPDACAYGALTDFVDRLLTGCGGFSTVAHGVLVCLLVDCCTPTVTVILLEKGMRLLSTSNGSYMTPPSIIAIRQIRKSHLGLPPAASSLTRHSPSSGLVLRR